MFSLQLKPDSKLYQAPMRWIAYALQKPVKEELERLQQQDIIPLGIEETVQWCNSFFLVPKPNGKVRLCLDPARLNEVILRPVHRGPTLNDIFPKLKNKISLIGVNSGYNNLKLDERSSYLTTFACQFGRYRNKRLPFRAAPTGDMFQWKIGKIFKDLPNVFAIANDILVVGYDSDGKDHNETIWQVLQICRHVNLKLNKDKCHFKCISVPFFGEGISSHAIQPNPQKLKALTEIPPPKTKRNSMHFLE